VDAKILIPLDFLAESGDPDPLILQEPAPAVVMGELGDHGPVLYARVWAQRSDYWSMYFDFLEQVKDALEEADIEIPYNQLDVHVKTQA